MMCEILFAVTLAVYPQSFEEGGWKLDCQFMDQIGSPYLLAHGIGQPCVDAKATVEIPEAGRWRVRARTRNWEKSAPGKFAIKVNGKALDKVFGAGSGKWSWEDGGEVELPTGKAVIALHDLTGFDGRCAGVVLERDEPIRDIGPLSVEKERPAEVVETDFTIVGGGMAGCCAAVAAARSGVRVALVQDRPVLGGNASGEIRVWCSGELRNDIVAELRGRYYNRDKSTWMLDEHRRRVVEDEENVSLFLSHRAFGVTKAGNGGIASVRALDIRRNRVVEFKSPLFLDATGDGWVGYWAGADYRMGRESRGEFGESMAPEETDGDTLGASVMWTSSKCVDTYPFSAPWAEPWAQGVEKLQGEWNWEYGIHRDMITDAEQIRDRLFLAIYGAFSLAKRRVENSRYRIDFMPYLLGKRESRRLLGDWVFKEADISNRVEFADAIAATSWPIDLHFDNCKPGVDYLTTCRQTHFGRAWVPFRSIYSRNIPNLMMAGRCFSCTHVGLGSPRVQNTLAQMGVAAGYAAAVCKREGVLPRGVYEKGLVREIQRKMGGDWPGNPDPSKKDWLIVDDEDEGVVFGEGWRQDRNENGGQVGQWTHIAVSEDGADPAVYPLPVPRRGRYALMMNLPYDPWYPERDGDKESSKPIETAFELTSGGKTVRFRVCQAARIGGWSELGEYELEPGAKLKIIPKESDLFWAPHADAFAIIPKNEFVSVWRADESKGRQTHWTLPDAAFVGNGDLGLVNGDAPGGKSFWICKGDFISGGHFFTKKKGEASEFEDPGMSATVGPFALRIEGVGTPEDTLSIATADLTSVFPRTDGGKVTVRTYVAKTANVIVSEIRGADGLTVEAGGALVETNGYACANGVLPNGDRYTWRRTPNTSGGKAGSWRSECALVTRQIRNDGVLIVVTAAYTADRAFNEKDERIGADAVKEAEELLESTLATGLGKLRADHEKWWREYWGRSSVTLGDEELERFYYGSLYVLAVAAPYGYSKVTPGLYGSIVTEDLNGWHNDFHLNYNFISPFYGVCAANRPDFIKALLKPIVEYLPDAKRNAVDQLPLIKADYVAKRPDLAHGIPGGALYPVALLQGGMSRWTRPEHYWAQVMNAPMTAAFFCTYWEYTHDEEFWREAYPFLEATARFFVGWCEKEPLEGGGYRYSFYDSLGESEGFCKNCSCTLEFVRHLFTTLAGRETDAAKRTLWRDYADHLAAWPRTAFTCGNFSRPILSLGESDKPELKIRGTGAVELEGIQPGEAFSFDIDSETRTRAVNTVDAMLAKCGPEKVWTNINQTPKLFVTGAKVGYPAEKIIAAFKEHQLRRIGRKNFTLHCGVHGIEKSGAIEFINAMLLQSDHGYVKLFPNWTGRDASFRKLRAKGGFLVSAELKGGKIRGVEVESIFGGTFRMVDPNPSAALPAGWRRGKTRHSGEVTLERDLAPGEKVTMDESGLRKLRAENTKD